MTELRTNWLIAWLFKQIIFRWCKIIMVNSLGQDNCGVKIWHCNSTPSPPFFLTSFKNQSLTYLLALCHGVITNTSMSHTVAFSNMFCFHEHCSLFWLISSYIVLLPKILLPVTTAELSLKFWHVCEPFLRLYVLSRKPVGLVLRTMSKEVSHSRFKRLE